MSPSHKLFQETPTLVRDALEGAALIGGHPSINVSTSNVLSAPSTSNVRVISGGGAGHEPAHGGFVGSGMLWGAVSGGVFASPSTGQVLSALQSGSSDALLVVKNYTGDRLSFGRAIERFNATSTAKAVMVVVQDDCALPHERTGTTGRRGLAGTILVYKVAGEAAKRGLPLTKVQALAEQVASRVGTVGAAVRDDGQCELGLGIHGEKGFSVEPVFDAKLLARRMVDMILVEDKTRYTLSLSATGDLVVFVNNLGSATDLEVNAFQKHVLEYVREKYPGLKSIRVVSGRLMTSLHMHGISLTLLVDPSAEVLELLDATPEDVGAWPGVAKVSLSQFKAGPSTAVAAEPAQIVKGPVLSDATAAVFKGALREAANALIAAEPILTEYDTIVGDGDCGHTLKSGASAILSHLDTLPVSHPASTLTALSTILENAMGGSSGVLYCILLDAAAGHLASVKESNPKEWAVALEKGLQAIMKYGGAKPGDRTMIDALYPLSIALIQNSTDYKGASAKAKEGAQKTAELKRANAGRSSYVGAELSVPDPGAFAVAVWVEAVVKALA